MTIRATLACLAAVLLTGCGAVDGGAPEERRDVAERVDRPEEPADRGSGEERRESRNEAKPAGGELASSRAPTPRGVTRDWFVGSWTDSGDCGDAAEFSQDGRFRLADGTRGMWNVTDERLVVQGASGRNTARLRRVDDDVVEVLNEDGSVGRSTRC